MSKLDHSPMLRISAFLCATFLIATPAFAGGCSASKDSASETTEQKKEVKS